MGFRHRRVEFVPQAEIERQPRSRAPVLLPIESEGFVGEMTALHSARYCREHLRGLILQKGRKSSGKIHPAPIPHRLTGNDLNAVAQEAKFQRVFSLRVKEV